MIKCKDCGTTDERAFDMLFDNGWVTVAPEGVSCDDCACDRWEAQRPEREQRERERLDSEGYYDDPEGWLKRKEEKRKAQEIAQLGRAPQEWSGYADDRS